MSMNRIVLLMLLIFLIEGSLMPWIIPPNFGDRIIPHFNFVIVIFAALYGSRHQALALGLGFGLLQDIMYYGHMIGPNSFFMGIIGYFLGILLERKRSTLMMAITVIGFACLAYDTALYLLYKLFRLQSGSYPWALIEYILPSLFLQLTFALIMYIPMRKAFEGRNARHSSDSTEE